jgi:arsenite methyltransferase
LKTNNGTATTCRVSDGTQIYESVRNVAGSAIRPGGFQLTERAISQCEFGENPRLLDAGCGTGATVDFLRKKFRYDVIALDISSSLFSSGSDNKDTFPFIQGDTRQLPFRDAAMDGILCECVISLLEKPCLAFAEFSRVIRPGGYLMVSDLYDRGGNAAYQHIETNGVEDLKRMPSRIATEDLFSVAGFELVTWEDHTIYLKELAAQLILNGFGADELGKSAGMALSQTFVPSCCAQVRPGYYLAVARKNS